MAARPNWWHVLQAGKNEALIAVDLYNRWSEKRSLEAFVVHMHLAWMHLLHAHFKSTGIDYRYRNPRNHFIRVNGEPKTWGLSKCVQVEWADEADPVRQNIEFFIGLRNRIEHRYEELLATAVAGKTQALVINFEDALVERFGPSEGLADQLRFPVFLSSLTPDAVTALKRTYRRLPARLRQYIRDYDSSLPEAVQASSRYDFRVYLLPRTGPKSEADSVMTFVREEDLTPEQVAALDTMQTIIRDKQVPVQNHGKYRPGQVAQRVSKALAAEFSIADNTDAWRYFEVRPPSNANRPEGTDPRYCVWDEPHADYLYTDAWVRKLTRAAKDPVRSQTIWRRGLRGDVG